MTFLVDENLSTRLPQRMARLFPGSRHVLDGGLHAMDDLTVWRTAQVRALTILTRDVDFEERVKLLGPPPKVVRIRVHNPTARETMLILRCHEASIREFLRSPNGLLVLPG